MQIVVKTNLPEHGAEWVMLEMQGQLESPEDEELSGQFIGDLHFNKKGIPILIIGHHILYGKVVTMEKPFLVLMKKNAKEENNDNEEETEKMETDEISSSSETETYYSITAIVKKKLIFKTRPKPIITNVPKRL
ncbi:chromosome transmission fidelity protein 8 homolog [Apostichopus japonicus]|uniref:chromosome transmission fidelity protein 8 homolog n=1 Tax=Stichopus japonicus TaxID=307972 RepID=UPI003AB61EE6